MSRPDLKYWVALATYSKIGPIRFQRIFNFFNSTKLIWQSSESDLLKAGLEKNIVLDFIQKRKKINPDQELDKNLQAGIKIITLLDKNYPKQLKKINSSPFILFYKGNLKYNEPCLAIIGTRKMSLYGKQVASDLTHNLVENNITTISGMALGIDSIVHKETIKSGGKTIAVLGSGLDKKNIYPKINYNLSEEIIKTGGLVISEHSANTPGLSYNFPQRNRIISALSAGILIIESPKKGGSLITANYAQKQKKKIFAVPGLITNNNSIGTNNLIKTKIAQLITNADDIIKMLGLTKKIKSKQINNFSDEEKKLLNILNKTPQSIDEIIKKINLKPQKISSLLMILELKGKIKNLGNMNYILNY